MSQIIVRPATNADFETLLRFEQGVIVAERPFDPTIREGPVNYYDIRYMLTAPEIRLMVAELDGILIGSGYARIERGRHYLKHTHHAYLGFMYVVPEHRGKGVNRLIIDALKNWAITQNINELRLDVYYDNHPAIAAYGKAGFVRHLIEMRMGLALPEPPHPSPAIVPHLKATFTPQTPTTTASPRPASTNALPQPALQGMSPLLLVSDLDRSIAFYTTALGFSVQFRYGDFYAGIARDGYSIHLKQAPPLATEREYKRSNEHVDITFSIANIQQFYDLLNDGYIPMVQPLREMPYGREFYVADPDGYILAFLEEKH